MRKIFLLVIIVSIILSACSKNTFTSTLDKYDIINKHLILNEVKYICNISKND